MSEEVEVEATEEGQTGTVTIEITDDNVKYNTNLSIPELVFWLEIVQNMVTKQVMESATTE